LELALKDFVPEEPAVEEATADEEVTADSGSKVEADTIIESETTQVVEQLAGADTSWLKKERDLKKEFAEAERKARIEAIEAYKSRNKTEDEPVLEKPEEEEIEQEYVTRSFDDLPSERKKKSVVTVAPVKPAFKNADLDDNGFLTAEEIEKILEEILEGRSPLTVSQFNELVQYYTYYTDNADPIDFGGTEIVYVDGILSILKTEGSEFKEETRRLLARKYKEADFNDDGDLTPEEVQKMINLFMKGESNYAADKIYELIDLYFE